MGLLRIAGLTMCVAVSLATILPAQAASLVLITADEAQLPPPKGAIAVS
jgi:hypothetical protein